MKIKSLYGEIKKFINRHRNLSMALFAVILSLAMLLSFMKIDDHFHLTMGSNAATSFTPGSTTITNGTNGTRNITVTTIITLDTEKDAEDIQL